MGAHEDVKQYRIGEYAHYLGVTPDFLKHYEQMGLICSVPRENGYRYYPFSQSFKILECIRLRNYGITLRDVEVMLHQDDLISTKEKLDKWAKKLEEQLRFTQALLKEHEKIDAWMAKMQKKQMDWQIVDSEELYFLPHSNRDDFIKDERIYEILNTWVAYMPLVKSCAQIRMDGTENFSWGLAVSKQLAQEFHIPLNGVVKRLPPRKVFLYQFTNYSSPYEEGYSRGSYRAALEKLQELGFTPTGDIYKIMVMYTHINTTVEQSGFVAIPID